MTSACNRSRPTGGDSCSAIGCSNARSKDDCRGLSFFRLPHKDEQRCRIWIQNMRRQDLKGVTMDEVAKSGYRLCSKHFEDSQFNVPTERKRLTWNAVPTVFDVPNPPPSVTLKRKQQTRTSIEPPPKKRKNPHPMELPEPDEILDQTPSLKKRLKTTQNKLYRRQNRLNKSVSANTKDVDIMSLLSDLPPVTAEFVITQIKLNQRKKHGRRWSEQHKSLALSLYHASRKAYCMLKKIFILPSISTVKKAVSDVQIYPGFSDNIIQLLAQKVSSMQAHCNMCCLVFDEMSIKEGVTYNPHRDEVEGLEDYGTYGRTMYAANHVTVFMVRGLFINWKQPVGYFLSSGPISGTMLSSLLQDCLTKLQAAGLNVKCVVADQGSNNRMALGKLGVTEDHPFFTNGGKPIYVFYDPPHLIKNIRNNLKSHGFKTEKGQVQWKHIEIFFNMDRKNPVRIAPKLTEKHINLPPFSSLRVKYATQVLSHSVAAGISFLAQLRGDEEAFATADFLERFDQLFNSFNSGNLSSKQKMGHALSNTSGHISFLHDTLSWIHTISSCSPRRLPCISGWKISIRALLMLWKDLSNSGCSFLLTSRLNQDCIENLFSQIRGHVSRVDNPSALEFRAFFRNVMVDSIFHHSAGSNCQEDSDKFLLSLKQMATTNDSHTEVSKSVPCKEAPTYMNATLSASDDVIKDLLETVKDNVLSYIGGYIARKVAPQVCSTCQVLLSGPYTGSSNQQFIKIKQYDEAKTGLIMPSEPLTKLIIEMEALFQKHIPGMLHCSLIKSKFFTLLWKHTKMINTCNCGNVPPCELQEKVMKLFFNIRLHFSLKECNESFNKKSNRRNRKMMKLQHI